MKVLLSCALIFKARVRGEKAAVAKPVRAGLRWRSSDVLTLSKFVARAAMNGHEIKLAGETGDTGAGVTPRAE